MKKEKKEKVAPVLQEVVIDPDDGLPYEEVKNLNALTVCAKVGIGVQTLANWYRFYKLHKDEEGVPELPSYYQLDIHSIRLWSINDIEKMVQFKQWVGRGRAGKMGSWNAKYWQERGERALKNKADRVQEESEENQ